MYIGDQPPQLKDLHPFQEAMIGLSCSVCTILQLREKDNGTQQPMANLRLGPTHKRACVVTQSSFLNILRPLPTCCPPQLKKWYCQCV